jgi:drug/metabolite transporter (DMT)-like permease
MRVKFSAIDLLLLLMVFFWGANISVIKVALRHFHPAVFNCCRFLIASVTMLILYRKVFADPVDRKELSRLLLLGILGNTMYQFMFIGGVNYTHVSHASILLGTSPIFTASLSSILGHEKIGPKIWFGILLSFCGIIFIVFGARNFQASNSRTMLGDLFVVLASLMWSIYTTFSRKIVNEYSWQHYIVYTLLFGTIFLVPFSLPYFFKQDWSVIGIYDWGAVLYSALLALVFGYSVWYYSVRRIGSTRTAVYGNLTPVAGVSVGMIFLGDRLTWLQWIGALVILTGLILIRLTKPVPADTNAGLVEIPEP